MVRLGGSTMGSTYEVKWVDEGRGPARDVVERDVERFLAAANAAFSTWDEDSVLSRFNAHASTEPFEVPAEHRAVVASVLQTALEVAAWTDGAFDPTVEPLVDLLDFGRSRHAEAPTAAEREAALRRVGWRKVRVLEDGRLAKTEPDVAVTLSGIVPGWAADELARLLVGLGASACMVDIGGEIACKGTKPGGQPWTIGIERPAHPGSAPRVHTTVPVHDGGLATSGSYRNFHLVGDEVVHHLLDPRTGNNVRHAWASVSVRADSAALADALATAFMVRPELAESLAAELRPRRVRVLFLGPPDAEGQVAEKRVGW